ncbi:MAG: hypothetical protein EAZ89_00970 [Bacteroidetes bacterium]|nr:MAG: hypothetical protein EAZ89_00970 [Bacteroidota bacterium]
MKINITKRHIKAAQLSSGKRTPVELAVMDLECFEDVRLKQLSASGYALVLDGEAVKLPRNVQKLTATFIETQEMTPFVFELKLKHDVLSGNDVYMYNPYEDSADLGLGYRFA